jgi:hypothetical protein
LKRLFKKFLKLLCVFAGRAESIGILFVKIGSLVKTLFLGVFFTKSIPYFSPIIKFGTFFNNRLFSPCQPESIGMLIVKIGQMVEKLFKRGVFHESCSLAPQE